MTPQRHFYFSFPEEMDGLVDFLLVCGLLLGIGLLKNLIYKILV